jgi:lipopolysaccharide heptosyltransferase I
VKRLLVVRLSALGDVIHTLPAVVSLKGEAEITWVVEAPYRELVELVAGVNTIPVRMKQWTREPSAMRDALRRMRGFDASIDFQGLIKSAVLPWVARARRRIGFDANAIREKPALLFTNENVRVDTTKHVIEQNLELASACGAGGFSPLGHSGHSSQAPRWAEGPPLHWDAFVTPVPNYENSIVLLPGAGKANKLWPIERFRELAKRIGPRALAVWGPGERELAEAIGARVAPPTNLRELAGILQKADVVIGSDTGPLHLAAALGTKVVGLYGPTDPRRNGPYGQLDHVVSRFATTKSMESISVNEVMETLQRVVRE